MTRVMCIAVKVTPVTTNDPNMGTCVKLTPRFTLFFVTDGSVFTHSRYAPFSDGVIEASPWGCALGEHKLGEKFVNRFAPLRALGSIPTYVLWTGWVLPLGGTGAMLGSRLRRA